jgi:hypothetical protein
MADMVKLSEAVPGWPGEMTRDAVDRTRRGVELENARLRGSQFLIVTRIYQLDYEGIVEEVIIEGGERDLSAAIAAAQTIGAQRLVDEGLKHSRDSRPWSHEQARRHWPEHAPRWEDRALPVFSDRLADHSGYNAIEVAVAVIPTDPQTPINGALVEAVGLSWELHWWFDRVAGGKL